MASYRRKHTYVYGLHASKAWNTAYIELRAILNIILIQRGERRFVLWEFERSELEL